MFTREKALVNILICIKSTYGNFLGERTLNIAMYMKLFNNNTNENVKNISLHMPLTFN